MLISRNRRQLVGPLLMIIALTFLGACGSSENLSATRPKHATQQSQQTPRSKVADIPRLQPHNGPCVGSRVDVPARQSALHVAAPLLVPRSKLASFETMKELWACASGGYVALFASGIKVDVLPGYEGVDNATKWSDYVKSNGYGSRAEVHGNPGMIEEPDGDHAGLAQTIVGGWLVQVLGDSKTPASSLVEVADTM